MTIALENLVNDQEKNKDLTFENKTEETVLSTAINTTRRNRKYTDADKENLFALVFEQGMSTNAAAIKLGMPPSTAYSWIKKEKERRSVTDEGTIENPKETVKENTKKNLFALVFEEGMSTNAAAIKLGMPPSTAYSWIKKEKEQRGVTAETAKETAKENAKEELFALVFEQGMSTNAAAIKLGMPPSTAYSWIKKEKEQRGVTAETAKETAKENAKEELFALVFEQGMSTNAAAIKLGMPPSTAYSWIKKEKERRSVTAEVSKEIVKEIAKETVVETPTKLEQEQTNNVDVKSKLGEEYEKFLTELIEEKLTTALADITKTVTEQFTDLNISQAGLKQLVNKKCKAYLEDSDTRNTPVQIEERYNWAKHWEDKDMDYMSNCVFIDKSNFHIKLTTLSKVDTMKPVTKTVFGAVSHLGLVNAVNVLPKNTDNSLIKMASQNGSAGDYLIFLRETLDIMDQHDDLFKNNYLVMDNPSFHNDHPEIKRYIEIRGYRCVVLPSHSSELSPMKQFWSACKTNVRNEKHITEETWGEKLKSSCLKISLGEIKNFCCSSVTKFNNCLDREPI